MNTSIALLLLAAPGVGQNAAAPSIWTHAAALGIMAVLFGGIVWLLRKLFGPGGRLRPEGLETIQEAKARREREHAQQEPAGRAKAPAGREGKEHDA